MRPCHLSEWHQKVAHSTVCARAEALALDNLQLREGATSHEVAFRRSVSLATCCAVCKLQREKKNPTGFEPLLGPSNWTLSVQLRGVFRVATE